MLNPKKEPIPELPCRVRRTYRGGACLERFLGLPDPHDSDRPEDWISSFTEAKNRDPIPGEGLSLVRTPRGDLPLRDCLGEDDLLPEKVDTGVLIKLLDAGERLGIQVHPTPAFAEAHFGSRYGKTECWHILATRDDAAAVYIGFREGITKEKFADLFAKQDIAGMLDSLHRIPVKVGDTILVKSGTPHAIGAGCFLLEIQEPTDYTMRVEKVTVAGEVLTPTQIHYGAGEEALLDCFLYDGVSYEELLDRVCPRHKPHSAFGGTVLPLVTHEDTPCFALSRITGERIELPTVTEPLTAVFLRAGEMLTPSGRLPIRAGDRFFLPVGTSPVTILDADFLLCYPPKH